MVDANAVACPATRKPGEDVIVPAPVTSDAAAERAGSKQFPVTDWYLARKHLDPAPGTDTAPPARDAADAGRLW